MLVNYEHDTMLSGSDVRREPDGQRTVAGNRSSRGNRLHARRISRPLTGAYHHSTLLADSDLALAGGGCAARSVHNATHSPRLP